MINFLMIVVMFLQLECFYKLVSSGCLYFRIVSVPLKTWSEWVSDCCLMPTQQFFSYIMVKNKLIFNEMMMRSTLYLTNTLSWIFIVLADWNNSLWIDMFPLLDTLSWFRANQSESLLFLLNGACLAKKQQIPIL